jgi:hypothetical protein
VAKATANRAWGVVEGAGRGVQSAGNATWDAVIFRSWRDGRKTSAGAAAEGEGAVTREEIEAVIEHDLAVEGDPDRKRYLGGLLGGVRRS